MARWNPTHVIIKNFAFGEPVRQYKKGQEVYLGGDVLDFAALNRCAKCLKTNAPAKAAEKSVETGSLI
jgi:hypothetical protein